MVSILAQIAHLCAKCARARGIEEAKGAVTVETTCADCGERRPCFVILPAESVKSAAGPR